MFEMFDRILSLRVGDVMSSDPILIDASASMGRVSLEFSENKLHVAPVVDDAGHCIGIISASDFVRRTELYSRSEQQPHEVFHREEGILLEPCSYDYVTDCMAPCLQTIDKSASMIQAAKIMTGCRLHALPVVEDEKPIGMISNLDIVAALVNAIEEAKQSL